MKICKKCGAVQDDSRINCLDCGTLLGKPVSEAEESQVEAELCDTIDAMGDRTDPYYVSRLDKIFALISIAAVIAIVVFISLANVQKDKLRSQLPETYNSGAFIYDTEGIVYAYTEGTVHAVTENSDIVRIQAKLDQCNKVGGYGIVGILCLICGALNMLFPKFVWIRDTLHLRLYIDESNLSPSSFYLARMKIFKYVMFVGGMATFITTIVAYISI